VEGVQVLRDCLPRNTGALREFGNRKWTTLAELSDDLQTGFVAQRRKDRRNAHGCD
jgi:hypothetical protein